MTPPEIPKSVLPVEPFAPTPMHLAQIQEAKRLGKKIRNATTVATLGGWCTGIFAAFTLLFSLGDVIGMVLGTGMAIVSYFEFKGSKDLKRLDPTAPRRLAINQLAFGVMLVAYGGYKLWASQYEPILSSEIASDPELAEMARGFEGLGRSITIIVYAAVIAAGVIGPGLTALYYYSRKSFIENYLRNTPQWILDLQRAGMTL